MKKGSNVPATLPPARYVVVDELHTFDGAQGTDLALLLRRLRRQSTPPELIFFFEAHRPQEASAHRHRDELRLLDLVRSGWCAPASANLTGT